MVTPSDRRLLLDAARDMDPEGAAKLVADHLALGQEPAELLAEVIRQAWENGYDEGVGNMGADE